MIRRDPLHPFERLEPPPGGLASLHEKLTRRKRREVVGRRIGWAMAAAVPAIVTIALFAWPAGDDADSVLGDRDDPEWIALGLVQTPEAPVTVTVRSRESMAVERVVETDDVVYYRVENLGVEASVESARDG